MRHKIEVEERIDKYERSIDNDPMAHYSTCVDNHMYYRRIEALKFFLKHNFALDKINNLKSTAIESNKKYEKEMMKLKWSEREDYQDAIEVNKRYIIECDWVLEDSDLPSRYKKEIKDIKLQIKELTENIKKRQIILKEMGEKDGN